MQTVTIKDKERLKNKNRMKKSFYTTFVIIIVSVFIRVKADNLIGWHSVGNPLLNAYPCNGSTDISVSFEPGLPPEEANKYSVYIPKNFPSYSVIKMQFDAETSVTLVILLFIFSI